MYLHILNEISLGIGRYAFLNASMKDCFLYLQILRPGMLLHYKVCFSAA